MKVKKEKLKKVSVILLAVLLVTTFFWNEIGGVVKDWMGINAKGRFFITIDGEPVNFTPDLGYPYLTKTQRTMVPIRIISENMGYDVDWSKDTWGKGERKVWISNNTTRIELEIGKSTAIVNGKVVPIDRDEKTGKPVDTKAELVGSRTYVPIRFITEAMGGKVVYDRKDGNHYIAITTGKEIIDEPEDKGEIVTTKQAKVIVGDGKEVTALADKYRYSYMNLGPGHYFDYKQNQKDGFIEPVIQITSSYGNDWFAMAIMNKKEYKGKGYEVRVESKYVKNTNWESIDYWAYGLPKEYGGKEGETVKYEISIRNDNKVKTYPFVITLDARKNVDKHGSNAHKIEH